MLRILVADGHGPTRDFVQRSLGDAGFEVLAATDAASAFELFASRRPAAVVLDADFSDGDAAALVRRLRDADPRLLLVVTDKEHLGRARGLQAVLPLGANAYVADPTRRELVERVSRLVSQAGAVPPMARRPSRPALPALGSEPEARGEVQVGAVARLLHQLWAARSDGVLAIEDAAIERRILLVRGAAAGCWSSDPSEGLLRWVNTELDVPEPARLAALEAMAGGLSPGAALVAAGVVEPGEPLAAVLRGHLRTRLVRAVGAREGRWRFHAGGNLGAECTPVELPAPLAPVLDGARARIAAHHLVEALRAVSGAYPARGPAFHEVVKAAALAPGDLRMALALDGRSTTRAWLAARSTELRDGLSLLWFLSLAGAVVFQLEPASLTPPPGRPRAARPPLPRERADALRQAALQILPVSHFQALGLDVTADTDDVERAYHEVASRFHPDGYAEWDLGDLADLLAAVQDRISAAYRALSSAEKRRAYLGVLVRRLEPAGLRRPGLEPQAEVALFRAHRALRARKTSEAAAALRMAVQLAPKEPEYLAMLAFASLHDPTLSREQRPAEARKHARRALALQPEQPRAAVALALAEERAGDVGEARRVVLGALRSHPRSPVLRELLHRLNTLRPPARV